MKNKLIPIFLCLLSTICYSENNNIKNDLTTIKYNLSIHYAPALWKKEHLNWDLDEKFDQTLNLINKYNVTSVSEYQQYVKNFFKSLHDYHVNVLFYSYDYSVFPLKIKEAEGRYFICKDFDDFKTFMTHEQLENYKKIRQGQEVLEIDGISVREYVEKIIKEELSNDYSPTGYAIATSLIFEKYGELGQNTPTGNFSLKLKDHDLNEEFNFVFTWSHAEEKILKRKLPQFKAKKKFRSLSELKNDATKNYSINWLDHYFHPSNKIYAKDPDSSQDEVSFRGFLPPLGDILWLNKGFYDAYIFKNTDGKKISYLRISDFMYFHDDELKLILNKFKNETVGLILDITDNPGGSLYYMYETLSHISNKPIVPPLQIMTLNQEEIFEALTYLDYLYHGLENQNKTSEEILEIHQLIQFYSEIIEIYEEGKKVTNPLFILGIDTIEPKKEVMFDKPILMLINEMDFSCGDFFPAMAQDNQIATLFGKKTAGAGGAVEFFNMESAYGIQGFSLTTTLGIRPNGKPIENLGVSPDIPYELTVKDLTNNYSDYVRRVNQEMSNIIKTKK